MNIRWGDVLKARFPHAAGLAQESLVLGDMLSIMNEHLLQEKIGRLSDEVIRKPERSGNSTLA